jgi:hypothetical protein
VALALGTAALVLVALLCELGRPWATRSTRALIATWSARRGARRERGLAQVGYDPGRELRAEHRAR